MPKLILVGGNEFQKADGIDEYIAEQANGVIDLLPYAGRDAGAHSTLLANERYEPLKVSVRPHDSSNLATPPTAPARVAYLSGGDSLQLREALAGSALWQSVVTNFLQGDTILAGSSAGAMVLFNEMLDEKLLWSDHTWQPGQLDLIKGLGLVKDKTIVVPHWNMASDVWKTNLVDTYDRYRVIGIDENTALVWEYGEALVVGLGKVVLFEDLVRNEYRPGDTFRVDFSFNNGTG